MKVLIISADTLHSPPSGPAYVAGAARDAGHTVEVFERLFAQDLVGELEGQLTRFNPKEIVDCIKRISNAPVVLGGSGFNYYGRDWLEYLDLDYGIRGEAEFPFPLYLKRLEEGGDIYSVPGCIFRKDGRISKVPRELVDNLDATALPAYELFDLDKYDEHNISPAIVTKRGCAFRCIYCPYRSLEGGRYRLKSPQRVVDEIEHIQKAKAPKRFMFCDNNFNAPQKHAEAICKEIIARKLDIRWGTGSLLPRGITDDLCRLFRDSGCDYINLSIEAASDEMLKRMNRGYTTQDIKEALACFARTDIPFGASLMIGAPGETPETISETFDLMDSFHIPQGIWVTVGICLWTHHQNVVDDARRDGQLENDRELFEGARYMSPELSKGYMRELIESLRAREDCTVQVNKPYAEYKNP